MYRIGDELVADNKYTLNGYTYKTDSNGRVSEASGKLRLKDKDRDRKSIKDPMDVIGKGDELPTDDRGHLIADRFDGANCLGNLIPQDMHINRSDYNKLETEWARALDNNSEVEVIVEVVYNKKSQRPTHINVVYNIDGEVFYQGFKNQGG